jgi:hypothetical protein
MITGILSGLFASRSGCGKYCIGAGEDDLTKPLSRDKISKYSRCTNSNSHVFVSYC